MAKSSRQNPAPTANLESAQPESGRSGGKVPQASGTGTLSKEILEELETLGEREPFFNLLAIALKRKT